MPLNENKRYPEVLFCIPNFSGGGAEKVMVTLMTAFTHFSDVNCVALNTKGPLFCSLPDACHFSSIGENSARKAILKLAKWIKQKKPEVIFSTLGYLNLAVLLSLLISRHRPKRIILREANGPSRTLDSLPSKWLGRLGYRVLYNMADSVICNASHTKAELISLGVKPGIIKIIPNPVDLKKVRKLALEEVAIPQFPNEDIPLFVAAGRLTKQKGMDLLIRWVNLMENQANLLIIGAGEEKDALEIQINDYQLSDRVKIVDFAKNPFPIMAKAEAILLGSRWEGLPNIALEALALGKLVIATNKTGGLAEMKKYIEPKNLVIAENEADFLSELNKIKKKQNTEKLVSLPPSTLPQDYHLEKVIENYRNIIFGS